MKLPRTFKWAVVMWLPLMTFFVGETVYNEGLEALRWNEEGDTLMFAAIGAFLMALIGAPRIIESWEDMRKARGDDRE